MRILSAAEIEPKESSCIIYGDIRGDYREFIVFLLGIQLTVKFM